MRFSSVAMYKNERTEILPLAIPFALIALIALL
jgi:hypothetical protein